MKYCLVLLSIFFCTLSLQALEKRPQPLTLKTSTLIPCHNKHFQFIPELLQSYAEQTVPPDEVIISVQQYRLIPEEAIRKVQDQNWPFTLKIVFDEGGTAGINRNNAAFHSTGDILITQDADDLPHPQRVEIIKYLFENFYVEFLMHRFAVTNQALIEYPLSEIEGLSHYFNEYGDLHWDRVHNGNVALARHVLNKVQWSDSSYGEDVCFNLFAFLNHQYKVGVFAFLVTYRPQFSSTRLP